MLQNVRCLLIAAPCLLAGCASTDKAAAPLEAAVTMPLSDLNLVQKDIPAVLRTAHAGPYRVPALADCPAIRAELGSLDDVLGPDLDAPAETRDTADKLGQAAGNAVVGAVTRTAEGVIPMRGWVRKLSGAERRQDEIRAATQAGMVRRAFIKGILATGICPGAPGGATKVAGR